MTGTSRPRCQIAEWCAKPPHPPEDGCSIAVRRDWRDVVERTVDQFVAALDAAHNSAVGGAVNDQPDTPPVDVNEWIAAIRKANETADEYTSIAIELGDVISRFRGLSRREVHAPDVDERSRPAMLDASLVKFDMGEQTARLERIQVAMLGYAGAWTLHADRWQGVMREALAVEEAQRDRPAEAERRMGHLTLPEPTDVLVGATGIKHSGPLCKCMNPDCPNEHYAEPAVGPVDATGIEYDAVHGEADEEVPSDRA